VQTPDGYLWVATAEGLARYDGVRFTVFTMRNAPGLSTNNPMLLKLDREGNLWIYAPTALSRYRGGVFTDYTAQVDKPSDRSKDIRLDKQGRLLVIGEHSIYRFENGAMRFALDTSKLFRANYTMAAFYTAPNGDHWIGGGDGEIYRWTDRGLFRMAAKRPWNIMSIVGFGADATGQMYVMCSFGVYRMDGHRYTLIYGAVSDAESRRIKMLTQLTSMLDDREGRVWFLYNNHVMCIQGSRVFDASVAYGLKSPVRTSFLDDRQEIWFLCGDLITSDASETVARVVGERFDSYDMRSGLLAPIRKVVAHDRDGGVWVGSQNGLICFQDSVTRTYGIDAGLPNASTSCLFSDSHGRLWAGMTGHGLYYRDNGRFVPSPYKQFQTGTINSMMEDTDGGLWLSDSFDVYCITGDKVVNMSHVIFPGANRMGVDAMCRDVHGNLWFFGSGRVVRYFHGAIKTFSKADGVLSPWVRAFTAYPDREGGIWVGTLDSVLHYTGGRFETYNAASGLPGLIAVAFHEDKDGTIWIGMWGGGLVRYKDGVFRTIAFKDGLYADGIFQIQEDTLGNLWLGSSKGIFRVERESLNRYLDGIQTTFECYPSDSSDDAVRAQCIAGINSSTVASKDSRFWFSTIQGLVEPEPRKPRHRSLAICFDSVVINGAARPAGGSLVIPPGAGSLEIRYTAPCFQMGDRLKFFYQLEGFDRNWLDRGYSREANYTNLPPGKYRFHVKAQDVDGNWSAPATIEFTLQPHFYQTVWFQVVVVMAGALCLLLLYRYRVRQLRRRTMELEIVIAERTYDLERAKEELLSQNDQLQNIQVELKVQNDELQTAYERIEALAITDGLTGIKNHRAFQDQLELEWKRIARHGEPLSLVLLDVDKFKHYNDTYGHPAGDEVLKAVGKLLTAEARETDFVARYGGEEFVILLPRTDTERATAIAERFRAAFEKTTWPMREVTASFGVSTSTPATTNPATLIAAADQALYESKHGGRNRVTHNSTRKRAA